MNISTLLEQSREFAQQLAIIKSQAKNTDFTFYGYDILSNLVHLDRLLTGQNRDIFTLLKDKPIADFGAADGDLSFFLHSLNYQVDIIDNPPTNWNSLKAAYYLKNALSAQVGIHEIDLDSYFSLPRTDYGLALFLGLLYHLQNPFYVLKNLAKVTEYCFISTRVAKFTANNQVKLADASVAYLLDADECNNDATNYWIFSESGLQKLLKRTGWQVLDWLVVGNTEDSDVSSPNRDARAFVFLKSHLK